MHENTTLIGSTSAGIYASRNEDTWDTTVHVQTSDADNTESLDETSLELLDELTDHLEQRREAIANACGRLLAQRARAYHDAGMEIPRAWGYYDSYRKEFRLSALDYERTANGFIQCRGSRYQGGGETDYYDSREYAPGFPVSCLSMTPEQLKAHVAVEMGPVLEQRRQKMEALRQRQAAEREAAERAELVRLAAKYGGPSMG